MGITSREIAESCGGTKKDRNCIAAFAEEIKYSVMAQGFSPVGSADAHLQFATGVESPLVTGPRALPLDIII
jgi:hypothetical protein